MSFVSSWTEILRFVAPAVVAAASLVTSAPARADLLCQNVFGKPSTPLNVPTVEIVGATKNAEGQELLRLRLIEGQLSWYSPYPQGSFAPQGNPLSAFRILGFDLATVIGFQFGPWDELLAPVPTTINARLDVFNVFLVQRRIAPILLSYAPQQRPTMISFLVNWSEGPSQPFAMGYKTHTIHDVTFHYPNIVLPTEVVQLMQEMSDIAQAWLDFNGIEASQSKSVGAFVRAIDYLSTSGNASEEDLSIKRLADHFGDVLRLRVPPYIAESAFLHKGYAVILSDYFAQTSPLSNFKTNLVDIYNEPATKQTRDAFFEKAAREHPEWTLTFAQRGLTDMDTIYSLYEKRADELRNAAKDFRKAQNAR